MIGRPRRPRRTANGNGGRYHYYACTGRQKYGPKACTGERLPREKLERAVLRQLAALYRDERLIGNALAKATSEAERRRPKLEQRLASISAEIARAEHALERYYEAFEQGKLSPERCEARLTHLQARLDDLRAQQAELSLQAPHEATHAPTAADLAAVADHLDELIAEAKPQKAKAVLRLLIEELRVNNRREILPTYRVVTPEVCAMSEPVEAARIEPAQRFRRDHAGFQVRGRSANRRYRHLIPRACGHPVILCCARMAPWRFNGWTTSASSWNRSMRLSLFSPSWASSSKGEP
jgi:site-specific DNA recombinase